MQEGEDKHKMKGWGRRKGAGPSRRWGVPSAVPGPE